ncbi:tRNA dihydrouridine synthase DusB [Seohaeicola saemankumensis]|uniref:tRNA-dihydrouridine synthase n=1 Tax=Seohaeicola saemankumensis TaxID=481181 RepID=A0ABW3THU6_9RHOB
MSLHVGDHPLSFPVLLAPLAGITDLPFRSLVASFGAGLVVSEMVACREIVTGRIEARERAELGADVAGTSVQIAGRDPHWMAEAARMIEASGARIIDINMGCPAKKVVGGLSGSALLREPDHALRLIEAVVGAVKVPVTLKTRLGWDDDCLNAPDIARRAEGAGVQMITIHGRTRCQFYKGKADWGAIAAVKQAVGIPVIANGDIVDAPTAAAALRLSGADGVMVGRAAQGRPWLLAQIAHALYGTAAPAIPVGQDFIDMVSRHYEAMLTFYGQDLGLRVARKHLGWYMDEAGAAAPLRQRILRADRAAEVLRLLPDALIGADLPDAGQPDGRVAA